MWVWPNGDSDSKKCFIFRKSALFDRTIISTIEKDNSLNNISNNINPRTILERWKCSQMILLVKKNERGKSTIYSTIL